MVVALMFSGSSEYCGDDVSKAEVAVVMVVVGSCKAQLILHYQFVLGFPLCPQAFEGR